MKVCRLIVAGGRPVKASLENIDILSSFIKQLQESFTEPTQLILVTGEARGADKLPYHLDQEELGVFAIESYPANWEEFGKAAGYARNISMAKVSDHLIAFWNGKSRGTAHMIKTAEEFNLEVKVVKVNYE